MISITNLDKYFNKNKGNEIHVIKNTSLELPDTGFVSILGHSGSGKTTLLNVIGGLDKASGTIDYDDYKITKYKMRNVDAYRSKNIGYIFQNYNLLLECTVYENLAIALDLIGIKDEDEVKKRISYALKAVGMYKYRKKKAKALSGGQQQRVSIARALIKKSKLIIADEPTGNLDSTNAVDVMNILKAISKNSLVLMVTHNNELANHFSDIIIEVKDGAVINRQNNESLGFKNSNNNKVYLGDFEKKTINNINVYGTKEEIDSFDVNKIDFIFINGHLYLKDNLEIKKLSNDIQVLDIKSSDDKKEDIEFKFDNSWYKDKYYKNNIFKSFINHLKMSYKVFRVKTKKSFWVKAALIVIGFLMGQAVTNLLNYNFVDVKSLRYVDNYYLVSENKFDDLNTDLKKLIDEKAIYNVMPAIVSTGNIRRPITLNFDASVNSLANYIMDDDKINVFIGTHPNNGEVVIGQNMADQLIESSNGALKYENIIGSRAIFYNDYIVSGISKELNNVVMLNDSDYYKAIFKGNYINTVIKKESKLKDYYDLIDGVAELDNSTATILSPNLEDKINSYVKIDDMNFKVVGHIRFKGLLENRNYYLSNYYNHYVSHGDSYFKEDTIDILEGAYPKNDNEILVSIYNKADLKIGDKYNNQKICGFYIGKDIESTSNIVDVNHLLVNSSYDQNYYFKINDYNKTSEILAKYNFSTSKASAEAMEKSLINANLLIYGIMFIVLTIVAVVFIYFVMRSRMINDIYTIGVYRCLGASKSRICAKYAYDSFVLSAFTTLVGYIIYIFFYAGIKSLINGLFYRVLGIQIFSMNISLVILGGVFVLLISVIFGVLPIKLLLRKTPSEIMSKYDI